MAVGSRLAIVLMGICCSAFGAEQPPAEIDISRIEIHCGLNKTQRAKVWQNVFETLAENYPDHAGYCGKGSMRDPESLISMNDLCQARVKCVKSIDGVDLLRGTFTMIIGEAELEVLEVVDVAW